MIQGIGKRLKQLREEKELTMSELSNLVDVSRSLISQVENGLAFPSLQTLEKLSNALGVSMSKFFEIPKTSKNENNVVVRRDERRIITIKDSRHKYHALAPSLANNDIEFVLCEFPPYEEGDEINYFQHDGEEYFYVLDGEITLTIGEDTYILRKDDSGSFNSNIRHWYVNYGKKTGKVLVAASEHSVFK